MGDGWGSDETSLNHIGTGIVVFPAIASAMLYWGVIPLDQPPPLSALLTVVAVCGLVGGVVNILGRGPLPAGAIIGLTMALGGFAVAAWWAQGRESVWWLEIAIAYGVGTIPGFLLQFAIQRMLMSRAEGGE